VLGVLINSHQNIYKHEKLMKSLFLRPKILFKGHL